MPNVSRPNGFRLAKNATGGSTTGQVNLYYLASASDEVFVGDVVSLNGSGDAYGNPGVQLSTVGGTPVGIVVGILHNKFDPSGNITTGTVNLDLPGQAQIAAGASGYVLVADDPNILLEVEVSNGTPGFADIGLNANIALGAGSRNATAVSSPTTLDMGTKATTATLVFQIRGFVQRPDNDVAAASARVIVGFNVHQYKSVGVLGA